MIRGRVARWTGRRKVNQVDQITSFGNPGQLKSFVDGILEITAHLVKLFPWPQRSGDPAAFPGKKSGPEISAKTKSCQNENKFTKTNFVLLTP